MTLLEVLTALTIFLLAMVVFGDMILANAKAANAIQRQNLATRLCQSKLHEVAVGLVPLSSADDTPFDDEPDYTWSLDAESGSFDGLWNVTVTVKRNQTDNGEPIQVTLTQMILDPSTVGSNEDVVPVISSANGNTGSSSSSSSGSSSPASSSTPSP